MRSGSDGIAHSVCSRDLNGLSHLFLCLKDCCASGPTDDSSAFCR